jgi:hypothetical protein
MLEGVAVATLEATWAVLLDDLNGLGREWPHVFFGECPTNDTDRCLLVNDDEFSGDEDVPAVAARRGFTRSLLVSDVGQVAENLRQQDPLATREVLLRALAYYFDRDAFIDITQ